MAALQSARNRSLHEPALAGHENSRDPPERSRYRIFEMHLTALPSDRERIAPSEMRRLQLATAPFLRSSRTHLPRNERRVAHAAHLAVLPASIDRPFQVCSTFPF